MMPRYIVICQQIVCGPHTPIETVYGWNGEFYPHLNTAKRAGWKIRDSDDFNIGVVDKAGKLTAFTWMGEPIAGYDLDDIGAKIFLPAHIHAGA